MRPIDRQLIEACQNGDLHTTQTLLQQGANPNAQNYSDRTPLMIAAQNGDINMLKLLIQLGANPHTTDYNGRNALHYAVENQNYDIAQYLLTELKLDPNAQDQWGRTPFLIATRKGDIPMLQLLAQHGADPHIRDTLDQTALHYATFYGHYQVAQYLLTQLQLDPNTQDRLRQTPFLLATQRKDIQMLQLLVQHGANPNTTDCDGQTALHHALKEGDRAIAKYLITQIHINPNIQDQRGYTPFLITTQNNDIDILQLLAQHGADPNMTDQHGQTALHYAVKNKNYHIAQYFLTQLKLDPNTQDNNGITPFMIAAQKGDIKMLKLLVQHGANPYIRDTWKKTALHYALYNQYHDIAQYLLTQLKLDPNTQDRDGITPLMIAASTGDIKMLRLLIQLGANPYATDHQGRNALHYAINPFRQSTVEYLITHLQLDPNAQDHEGITPLLIAIERRYTFITQTLIQLGANPYIPNHRGETPAAIARRRKIPLPKPQPSTITL